MPPAPPSLDPSVFLTNAGAAGERIASYDWATTSLGPIESWPATLRTALGMVLYSPFPIALTWGPELVTFHNDAYGGFLGDKPDAIGRPFLEVWAEAREALEPLFHQALAGEALVFKDAPFTLLRHGRSVESFFDFSLSPVRDETGRVVGVFNVSLETTARVQGERRQAFLLELSDALRPLGDAVEVQAVASRLLGRHLRANRVAYAEDMGDGETVTLTRDYTDGVPSIEGRYSYADYGEDLLREMRAGRAVARADIAADPLLSKEVKAAHAVLQLGATLNVPLVKDQRLLAILGVHYTSPHAFTPEEVDLAREVADRTWAAVERARAEAHLRELNETLESRVDERTRELHRVWQNSQDLQVVIDAQGVFKAVNPAATRLLGWLPEEMVGRPLFEFTHPEGHAGSTEKLDEAAAHPTAAHLNRYRDTSGNYHWFSWITSPADGLIYCYGRDVTAEVERQAELVAAQEQLRQSQKMDAMGQLTGGVAHDFNNLLTPILGGLDRLQRKGVGDARDQRMIEGALQSADRAKTLVQRLLAFARRQPLQPTAIDVAELVEGMAELVKSTTGPQIDVAVDVAPDLALALADANQLEMAILNLAVNSRDAMPRGGTLRISARNETVAARHASGAKPGRYIRLSVADTGAGMDEATLERAIEPFFSTKGVGRGTGLGLSMVHGLAAQLGGALTLKSRPDLGTNVELWLPAADPAPHDARAAREAPSPVAPLPAGTVLLVDDEDLVRASTADMLGDMGYSVVEAESAEAALRILDEGLAPDLLLTDHLMPGLTGTELVRIVARQRPRLPAIIVSGYADVEGVAADLPRLGKPFRRAELAAIISKAMGR